jgi:hypothetical protein
MHLHPPFVTSVFNPLVAKGAWYGDQLHNERC